MGPAEHDGWQPTAEVLETSRVSDFCNVAGYGNFEDLLAASVEDPPSYWASAVDYLGLPFSRAFDMVVDESSGVAHPRWFVGGETNAAAMCLDRWLEADSESPAVDWHGEDGSRRGWTRRELSQAVEGLAAALRGRGIRLSDRVAILMPMVPEAVAAFLAIARIGAVAVPLFSGFGTDAIRVRLEDSSVSAILTMDRTLRGGRHLDVARNALAASAELETVHTIVVAARDGGSPEIEGDPRVIPWPRLGPLAPSTVPVDSDHPLLIAYTSGTTGRPKGAVHTHSGLPVKVAAEGAFQHDIGAGDTLMWISDMGWIMGPYQIVAALANGATLCLVEGVPTYPGPDRLWSVAAESRVSILGASPTLVRSLMPAGPEPVRRHDLSRLRSLGSTGEPWDSTSWKWYFEIVGRRRCPVINMSGGTEVGGALLSPHPVQTIPPGSLRP